MVKFHFRGNKKDKKKAYDIHKKHDKMRYNVGLKTKFEKVKCKASENIKIGTSGLKHKK